MPLTKETLNNYVIDNQDLKDKILNLLESNERNLLLMQQGSDKITDLNADLNIAKTVNAELTAVNEGLEKDNSRLKGLLFDRSKSNRDFDNLALESNRLKRDYEILEGKYKALCSRFGSPANL